MDYKIIQPARANGLRIGCRSGFDKAKYARVDITHTWIVKHIVDMLFKRTPKPFRNLLVFLALPLLGNCNNTSNAAYTCGVFDYIWAFRRKLLRAGLRYRAK